METSFKAGSRGFLISDLQMALGLKPDGIWGPNTTRQISRLQQQAGLPVTGSAGPSEFQVANLSWPDLFERAINMVSNFEGTSFGNCNATDIDGAGLTLGIAGFTTAHGEVQSLLRQYLKNRPTALEFLPALLGNQARRLLDSNEQSPQVWRTLFFGSEPTVRGAWQRAFLHWGHDPAMRQLQLSLAQSQFWNTACAATRCLGFKSEQAYLFFLDVAVQNGGWRTDHVKRASLLSDWSHKDESCRLCVAAKSVADAANPRWRHDVLVRKMAIAQGFGRVHGRDWKISDHAIG